MLTGLLMLWMAAGQTRGQALNDKPYNDTLTSANGQIALTSGYTNHQNEFIRGVDLFEDGTLWVAEGIRAATDNLVHSRSTRIAVFDNAWSAAVGKMVNIVPNLPAGVPNIDFLDHLWPNDLACDHPSQAYACSSADQIAFAGGGFHLTIGTGITDEENEGGPPVVPEPTLGNAWIVRTKYTVGGIVEVDDVNGGAAAAAWKTFIADASPAVPESQAYCEVLTLDTADTFRCDLPIVAGEVGNARARLISGGAFKGTMHIHSDKTFPQMDSGHVASMWESANGSQDGFFFIHNDQDLRVTGTESAFPFPIGFQIASSGDDAVLSVSVNQTTADILVCGYYGAADVNFDPTNSPGPCWTTSMPYEGGRDWFVACYFLQPSSPFPTLRLRWVARGGTEFDDAAEGVIADPSGDVFFTGWDTANGTTRSLMTGGILNPGGGVGTCRLPTWMSYSTPTSGPAEGMDIAVDGIGRPIVTGDFSGTLVPATGSGISIASNGGSDAMVIRYNPETGEPMEGFGTGGTQNDYGTDVSVCQFNSARVAFGGDFRGDVDFNPDAGGIDIESAVIVDGFASVFDHMPLSGAIRHVTVVLPDVVEAEETGQLGWAESMQALEDVFNDGEAFPLTSSYPPVPKDGTVSFQFVRGNPVGFNDRWASTEPEIAKYREAYQEIPITTIDSALTARLVAKRVKAAPRMTKSNESKLDSPMRLAAAYFEGTGPSNWAFKYPDHADYRSVLFLTEKFNQISGSFPPHLTPGSLSVLVNDVTAPGGAFLGLPVTIHQSNAIGLDSVSPGEVFSRDAAKIHMENANWRWDPPVDDEDNLGIVAEAVDLAGFAWTSPQYLDVLHRMISRLTVCPSDYNRDGVSNSANPGADWTPFLSDYLSSVPYSDWNFSGLPNPSGGSASNQADGAKFEAGFNAGCPNN